MQDTKVSKVGFVIAAFDNDKFKVLLAKSRPGQWRFPTEELAVALSACGKDAAEPFRTKLELGKSSYINNVFFRDAKEGDAVSRFYALKCGTADQALASTSKVLDCATRWASFEEASWVLAPEELSVLNWAERLIIPKPADKPD